MGELFALALPVLTIGFFIWFFLHQRRPRKPKAAKTDHNTRQLRAVWAWAKILSSSQGPLNTFRMARVELQLEVHLPGTSPYQAKTTWLVEQDALASVEAGKEIALKVDPQGPQYVYPNGAWAKFVE
ncbi:MAG: hypothetical protein WCE68_14680 [Anaerolineales bacterium]